jgi:hypothetical protein
VKQAKLRSLLSDNQKIYSAVMSFKLEYDALPGDIRNITSYYSNCTGSCQNGNGDGIIDSISPDQYEWINVFKHLSRANLIEGDYELGTQTGNQAAAMYQSSFEGVIQRFQSSVVNQPWRCNLRDYYIRVAGVIKSGAREGRVWSGAILPSDAYNIDNKLDDGNRFTGNIRAQSADWDTQSVNYANLSNGEGGYGQCGSGADYTGTGYNLDGTIVGCNINFCY